jgi:sugar transferase (PEP-CTERM system associated)
VNLSRLSTGSVLFALDAVILALVWPLVLAGMRPDVLHLLWAGTDIRGIVYPLSDLLALYAMGLYRRDAILETERSLSRIPLVVGIGATGAIVLAALPPLLFAAFLNTLPRDQAKLFALATVCFTLCAFVARLALIGLLRQRVMRRTLLVIGAGQRAWDLLHMLGNEGRSLNYEIALLQTPDFGPVDPRLEADPTVRIITSSRFDVLDIARSVDADQIVVAPDERRGMDLMRLLECKAVGFPIVPYLSFVEKEIRRIDLKRIELGWLVYSEGFSFGAIDRFLKRLFDLVISSIMLLLCLPLLLGAMAAIRLEGKGPIFYRQERVTLNGRVFRIVKLRTMRVDAEAKGAVWAQAADKRITRSGAFLRRSRIDELPQLWNILKGEMSFVGPRPERPVFVAELAAQIPLYQERHMVKAGLTGWAQINYPYGASIDDARSKLSYDLYYVKNFSIFFDVVILLQTLRVVLWPSGVR